MAIRLQRSECLDTGFGRERIIFAYGTKVLHVSLRAYEVTHDSFGTLGEQNAQGIMGSAQRYYAAILVTNVSTS